MKKALLALSFLLLLPPHIFAAEFVQQPLFLSKSPVTADQKVHVYAIVSNDTSTAFSGTVLIQSDGVTLGSPAASLDVGATQTVSVSWTPVAGTHLITAQLIGSDGTVVQQVSQSFTILAAPIPVASSTPLISANQPPPAFVSSAGLQQEIANISPAVATDTQPVFAVIDSLRSGIANVLDTQIAQTEQALNGIPEAATTTATSTAITITTGTTTVLAASSSPSLSSSTNVLSSTIGTFYLYLLIVLRFLVDNALSSYLLLLLIIIISLFALI